MSLKIGKYYQVTFLDHSIGYFEAIETQVIGQLVKKDRKCLHFANWVPVNCSDDVINDNQEISTVVRSCITEIHSIKFTKIK